MQSQLKTLNPKIIVNDVNICPWQIKWDVIANNPKLAFQTKIDILTFLKNGIGKKDQIYHSPIETLAEYTDGFEVPADIRFFDKYGKLKKENILEQEISRYHIKGENKIKIIHAPYEESPFHYSKFNILDYISSEKSSKESLELKQKLSDFMTLLKLTNADLVMHLGRIKQNSINTNEDIDNLEIKLDKLADELLNTVENRPKKTNNIYAKILIENMPYDNDWYYIGSKLDQGKRRKEFVKSMPYFLELLKSKFENRGYKHFEKYFGICFDLSHALSATEHQKNAFDISVIELCIKKYYKNDIQMLHLAGHIRPGKTPENQIPFLYDNHIPIKRYIQNKEQGYERNEYEQNIKKIISHAIQNTIRINSEFNTTHSPIIHLETQLATLYNFEINPKGLKNPQEIFENIDFVKSNLI